MTLVGDLLALRTRIDQVETIAAENRTLVQRHEEQISGERGLSAAISKLDKDVQGLRRNLITVGGMIFVSMVAFTISVLTVFGH